jgi:hypothetical protein
MSKRFVAAVFQVNLDNMLAVNPFAFEIVVKQREQQIRLP